MTTVKGSIILRGMYAYLEKLYNESFTKEEFEKRALQEGYSMSRLEAFYAQRK